MTETERRAGVPLPRLRRCRRERLLTQETLAMITGMSRVNIARIEAGQAAQFATVARLALALGVEPDALMSEPEG